LDRCNSRLSLLTSWVAFAIAAAHEVNL